MTLMDFYLSSNHIREFVLRLCRLSEQVFEISLNSSLVTDELSSLGSDLKSYAVYSEKMNTISTSLGNYSKTMLRSSTRIMELSLEKTTCNSQIQKIREGLALMSHGSNIEVVKNSIKDLEKTILPLDAEAADIMGNLDSDLKHFDLEIKKLWLLSTNLRTQVEFDEIVYLTNINNKIEVSLQEMGEAVKKLRTELHKLGNIL